MVFGGSGGGLQQVGVRAVVEGVSKYVSDARRVNRAQTGMGTSAEQAARDTDKLNKSLTQSATRMQETGRQAIFLGGAILGAAAAPAFLAARFDAEFVKIENLVGESREVLAGLREDVLDIGRETARGPQELARALFVVESGGLRGAEAIATLNASAKAAAIGLGDTGTVARITTQAVLAFRDQNLGAAEAVDILVATARAGNFETSQLAGVFGRVLPLAAELGVRFSDLGAFVAAFTRVGGDATNATTALSAVLTALTRGGSQAIKTLDSVGLSLEDLRDIAREEGLAQALFAILEAAERGGGAAEETLAAIIPNIRALRGVLATAGVQADEFLQIQEDVANSLGLTDAAIARLDEDKLFQFQRAITSLQIALVEVGGVAAPALSLLATTIGALASAISGLPVPLQQTLAAFAALSGTVLVAGGTIAVFTGALLRLAPAALGAASALRAVAVGGALLTGPAGLILLTTTIIAAAAAFFLLSNRAKDAADAEADLARETAIAAAAATLAQEQSADQLRDTIALTAQRIATLKTERAAIEEQIAAIRGSTVAKSELRRETIDLVTEEQTLQQQLEANGLALEQVTGEEQETARAAEDAAAQVDALADAMRDAAADADSLSSSTLATKLALDILTSTDEREIGGLFAAATAQLRELLAQEAAVRDIASALTGAADPGGVLRGTEGEDAGGRGARIIDDTSLAEAETAIREAEQLLRDARTRAEQDLELLGDNIQTALRRQAEQQRDLAVASIRNRQALERQASEQRIRQLDEEEEAARRAVEARTEATLGPLRDQLAAIDEGRQAEERARLERAVALAFDFNQRAEAQARLREFDRRATEEGLAEEIASVEAATQDELAAVEAGFEGRREAEQQQLDARLSNLQTEADFAEAVFQAETDSFRLESEARRLILEEENEAIAALLDAQVPEWRQAGIDFSEALLDGFRTGGALEFVSGLSAGVGAGRAAGAVDPGGGDEASRLQLLALQIQAGGGSESLLQRFRDQISGLGSVPSFQTGGVMRRSGLASLEAGEVVLTREQAQTVNSGTTIERGAFEGMLSGASFTGSPEENAAAIRREFEQMLSFSTERAMVTEGTDPLG